MYFPMLDYLHGKYITNCRDYALLRRKPTCVFECLLALHSSLEGRGSFRPTVNHHFYLFFVTRASHRKRYAKRNFGSHLQFDLDLPRFISVTASLYLYTYGNGYYFVCARVCVNTL